MYVILFKLINFHRFQSIIIKLDIFAIAQLKITSPPSYFLLFLLFVVIVVRRLDPSQ